MKRTRSALVVTAILSALAVGAPAGASAATCAGEDLPASADVAQLRSAITCLVNVARTTRGLAPVASDDRLQAAAQAFAEQMVAQGFFDHTGLDGSTPGDRITATGFAWSAYGENIAYGQPTPRAVVTGWMASTGHCHNILSPSVTLLGVGSTPARSGGGMWVQDFATPRGVRPPSSDTTAQDACPQAAIEGPGEAPAPATTTPATIKSAKTTKAPARRPHRHPRPRRTHRNA